ncbi:DUF4383 domain-containing protein [Stackebrandtia nassauensis]|uniref:DUF4383 domain-containing protein n=1 Tax=Stackebrandtia nassauensis (strain DSM 44728 / CIP 108903 / NRRL B-16338 / NBRC 102104 / LLR-40K-21) TaxID=446470 RepID=D3PXF2_STANL|nr:DUF4383 domain-containing protein [Stackebrandtia nassauensis]ADD41415.1 hypothetical protein Snas_1716 [Stackebrandtia nassauensis DSM 44728]
MATTTTKKTLTPIQWAAAIVGAVFLLAGIAGFVPGLTTEYHNLETAGHESHALLLGLFQVSILHNVVHLLFGVVGLAVATTNVGSSYWFLVAGGAIYVVLWVYGMLLDPDSTANFVPLNAADNWLHLLLGVGMVGLGLFLRGKSKTDVKKMVP